MTPGAWIYTSSSLDRCHNTYIALVKPFCTDLSTQSTLRLLWAARDIGDAYKVLCHSLLVWHLLIRPRDFLYLQGFLYSSAWLNSTWFRAVYFYLTAATRVSQNHFSVLLRSARGGAHPFPQIGMVLLPCDYGRRLLCSSQLFSPISSMKLRYAVDIQLPVSFRHWILRAGKSRM